MGKYLQFKLQKFNISKLYSESWENSNPREK